MEVKNILTIDLEDWYHGLFSIDYSLNSFEDRIEGNSIKLLNILSETNTKATFFVLGVVAEQYPEIVRRIYQEGHEIGTHGYSHKLVYNMSPKSFAEDIQRSLDIIEKIIGCRVLGYRAPAFSLTKKTNWVFDILREKGFRYDASIYPTKNMLYGIPEAFRFPHKVKGMDHFVEVPGSTIRIFGKNIPFGGGFYLRAYPYIFTKFSIIYLNKSNKSVVIYVHPWDFDPDQPKLNTTFRESISHYYNLRSLEKKFKMLLNDFIFCPIRDLDILYS